MKPVVESLADAPSSMSASPRERFRGALLLVIFCSLSLCSACRSVRRSMPTEFARLANPTVPSDIRSAYEQVRTHTSDPDQWGRLGMLLQAYREYALAASAYRAAREGAPRDFRWRYYLGVAEGDAGRIPEALADLHEAVRLDPSYLPTRLILAKVLLDTGNAREAESVYSGILNEYSFAAEPHYGLGKARAAREDWSGAIDEFRRACDLFPAYGAAHYALGTIYARLGDETKAAAEFALHRQYGQRKPEREDQLLEAVARLDQPSFLLTRAARMDASGQLESAAALCEQLLLVDPHSFKAHLNLISLYTRLGRYDLAFSHYRSARDLKPDDPELQSRYGFLLLHTGDYNQAAGAFRRALAADPGKIIAHQALGDIAEHRHRPQEALQEYRAALSLDPGNVAVRLRMHLVQSGGASR